MSGASSRSGIARGGGVAARWPAWRDSYGQLLVLRGVGGIGSAMFTVSAYSLLLRSAPTEQRGQATGLFTGGFLVGGITGPALGGLISEISIRAPFFLYAGTLAVAGSIGLFLLPRAELRSSERGGPGSSASLGDAARSAAYRAALAAQFADSWTMLGRARRARAAVRDRRACCSGGLGSGPHLGRCRLRRRRRPERAGAAARRPLRRPGRATTGRCCSGTPLSDGRAWRCWPSSNGLVLYLVALVVLGLGAGLLDVAPGAIVGDTVTALPTELRPTAPLTATEPGRGGTVVAAFQMTGDLGSVLGPLLAGRLADGAGYGAAFGLTAGVTGVALVFALFAPETRRPADATAAREQPPIEEAGRTGTDQPG